MKKGDLLELDIEGYAFEGKGISRIGRESGDEKNFVVFVQNSYPGDKVKAKLIKIKKSFAEAKTTEIIFPSSERVEARCKYFEPAGDANSRIFLTKHKLNINSSRLRKFSKSLVAFQTCLPTRQVKRVLKCFRLSRQRILSFTGIKWSSLFLIKDGSLKMKYLKKKQI